ncbi:MAG: dehydrogenase [Rhodothermales bacterium]|nr:dehydrogenase [Rhodothermales bacterium]
MLRLIRQNRISKWFSGYGQEAIAVGCALALRSDDYILPTHRNLGVWTTRGVPLKPLFCQLMGKDGGYTKGRDRTFHFGLPDKRIIGMISHMAAMLPVACGLAQAAQYRKDTFLALAFCGDGASREGDFHEALNLAAAWKLPVIFVLENNGYGLSTPTREAMVVEDLADAAAGYGLPGQIVEGNDIAAVMDAVGLAAERARSGKGPTLLEMKTFRVRGHEEASGTKYVAADLIEEWSKKDPVALFSDKLLSEGDMTRDEMDQVRSELDAMVDDAAEYALSQPMVASSAVNELGDVFSKAPSIVDRRSPETTEMRFIDAITDGLRLAMQEDDRIVTMGQDIAGYGGVFKVTQGFSEEFGPDRVRNTPIIESGIVGAALGLAIEGLVPVVEMQYADFITCAFNQIVNNLATTRYRWGTGVNVTIRAPFGGNLGAGPFHSQSVEAWFCHVPGLKVVIPGSPEDAKGLLCAAIKDPNPVLFFEHKFLYRALKGPVPGGYYEIPLGKARVAARGESITIVTYGLGVEWALQEAAARLPSGVSIEVIDLRTLVPLDIDAIVTSVRKTGRLIVLHEATLTGGFGGEIISRVIEAAFEYLDAPPARVAAEDLPVPFSINLEQEIFSARKGLSQAIDNIIEY